MSYCDRLCGLVVRVPGYRSRGPGFDSLHYQIVCEAVGLERGPLSLVSTTEELLWKKKWGAVTLTLDANVGTNFANKRRSLCRHSSLVGSGHGV
jgi:hypothetical protein